MADGHIKEHDYHLVDPSPWPIASSISALILAVGAIVWMRSSGTAGEGLFGLEGPSMFFVGAALVAACAFFWWRDIIREAHKGDHTPVVQLHLRYGMLLFIISEVMFFVAWFWAYFDMALFPGGLTGVTVQSPDGATALSETSKVGLAAREALTGGQHPPIKSDNFQHVFDPWGLPLVNTLILLLSGTTVTWAHHAMLENNRRSVVFALVLTIALGVTFTFLQAYEYGHAAFSYSGHIYGATFFMATGFHGAHVIIGTLFLAVVLLRVLAGHFSPQQHFGFEAAAWYWHFVDVVWLFLFAAIYIWGAG